MFLYVTIDIQQNNTENKNINLYQFQITAFIYQTISDYQNKNEQFKIIQEQTKRTEYSQQTFHDLRNKVSSLESNMAEMETELIDMYQFSEDLMGQLDLSKSVFFEHNEKKNDNLKLTDHSHTIINCILYQISKVQAQELLFSNTYVTQLELLHIDELHMNLSQSLRYAFTDLSLSIEILIQNNCINTIECDSKLLFYVLNLWLQILQESGCKHIKIEFTNLQSEDFDFQQLRISMTHGMEKFNLDVNPAALFIFKKISDFISKTCQLDNQVMVEDKFTLTQVLESNLAQSDLQYGLNNREIINYNEMAAKRLNNRSYSVKSRHTNSKENSLNMSKLSNQSSMKKSQSNMQKLNSKNSFNFDFIESGFEDIDIQNELDKDENFHFGLESNKSAKQKLSKELIDYEQNIGNGGYININNLSIQSNSEDPDKNYSKKDSDTKKIRLNSQNIMTSINKNFNRQRRDSDSQANNNSVTKINFKQVNNNYFSTTYDNSNDKVGSIRIENALDIDLNQSNQSNLKNINILKNDEINMNEVEITPNKNDRDVNYNVNVNDIDIDFQENITNVSPSPTQYRRNIYTTKQESVKINRDESASKKIEDLLKSRKSTQDRTKKKESSIYQKSNIFESDNAAHNQLVQSEYNVKNIHREQNSTLSVEEVKHVNEVIPELNQNKIFQMNIDDETCILNMNKKLFKKFNIDIYPVKTGDESIKTIYEIAAKMSEADQLIIITDYKLEYEFGDQVLQRIMYFNQVLKDDSLGFTLKRSISIKQQGLSSTEDISVKDKFKMLGVKLFPKPMKKSFIEEIIQYSSF